MNSNAGSEQVGPLRAQLTPVEDYKTVRISDVSDEEVHRVVNDIRRDGFAEVRNFVLSGQGAMEEFVLDAVAANHDEYISFTGTDALAQTPFGAVARDPSFVRLLKRVYEIGLNLPPPEQPIYQVLRCLKGASGLQHSLKFHYDSYVVTALLPVFIPTAGVTGDLLMLKRRRNIRRHYVHNLVDKIRLDNPITQRILRGRYEANSRSLMRVKISPGNLYFFWGYQTVHANERCDVNQLRATALFHYNNPHADSFLRQFTSREVQG
jgi:hypothetical protein